MMRLERLREEVRQEVTTFSATSMPDDAMIDRAISNALGDLAPYFPLTSTVVTVVTSGPIQNIKLLAPAIHQLHTVQYPYDATNPTAPTDRYTIVSNRNVVFKTTEPQAGELIYIEYKERYTLDGLNDSIADTLPDEEAYENALRKAAAANLYATLATNAMLTNPDPKTNGALGLLRLSETCKQQAIDAAIDMQQPRQNPVWSTTGLE